MKRKEWLWISNPIHVLTLFSHLNICKQGRYYKYVHMGNPIHALFGISFTPVDRRDRGEPKSQLLFLQTTLTPQKRHCSCSHDWGLPLCIFACLNFENLTFGKETDNANSRPPDPAVASFNFQNRCTTKKTHKQLQTPKIKLAIRKLLPICLSNWNSIIQWGILAMFSDLSKLLCRDCSMEEQDVSNFRQNPQTLM